MLWTVSNLNDIYDKANTSLYKLREKAMEERLLFGDNTLYKEVDIIYDLLKAVEWADANPAIPQDDEGYQGLISYLRHKVDGYAFDADVAVYLEAVDTNIPPPTVIIGAWRLFIQLIVGVTAGAPPDGGLTYTNAGLIGKEVEVYLDGLKLTVGLVDRQSYTFNPLTGAVTFTSPLGFNQVIEIYVLQTA